MQDKTNNTFKDTEFLRTHTNISNFPAMLKSTYKETEELPF